MSRQRDIPQLLAQALALHQQGRLDDAAALYRKILALQPQHFDALHLLGALTMQQGDPARAVELLARAVRLNPRHAAAHNNLGLVMKECRRIDDAIAHYGQAIALDPGYTLAWCNRGVALQENDRPAEALRDLDQALALKPDYADALYNRGIALQDLCRIDDAIASYEQAARLNPDHVLTRWNLAMCHMLRGDFAAGWAGLECRREGGAASIIGSRDLPQPHWLGNTDAPLAGKSILLYAEQGLGDTLQFCRYALRVAALGARVVLEVQPTLKPLLAESLDCQGHDIRVIARGDPLPAIDYQCPLLSLPLVLGTTPGTIPAAPRYLAADPQRLAHWQARCGPRTKPRIGLVWSGNPTHRNDRRRSLPLAALAPLLTLDAELFSLQQEIPEADLPTLQASGLRHFGNELRDFADTAALCELMDVIVCVDTSVAHLAGALGRPVWIMLPFSPDWRWLLGRDDSPWYPTARLFRQRQPGDWADVVARLHAALAEHLGA